MQERLTRRAYDAYGKDVEQIEVLSRDEFLLEERDMSAEQTKKLRGGDPELEPLQQAVKLLQGVLRRSLITPLFPWIHISRLACFEYSSNSAKRQKERSKSRSKYSTSSSDYVVSHLENPPPPMPWCRYVSTGLVAARRVHTSCNILSAQILVERVHTASVYGECMIATFEITMTRRSSNFSHYHIC